MNVLRLVKVLLVSALLVVLVACKPFASFTINPTAAETGTEVTFDASESSAAPKPKNNAIVSYSWDFGDGNHGSGRTAVHTYSSAGTFTVTLTVTDTQGKSASQSQQLAVTSKAVEAGPINPVPSTLWKPPAGAVPPSGSYVYLESASGDYIGQGLTHTYTPADATLTLNAVAGHLAVRVQGNQIWTGDFQGKSDIAQLQPGYYPNVTRHPFHDNSVGGLSWSGDGRGCNTLTGWFAIDSVTYVDGTLRAIDLRFEQHCEGASAALRGAIHWTADDGATPSGPANPPPASLWQPAPGTTPTSGNYIYLESETGDYIGAGQAYTYTPESGNVTVSANGAGLNVMVLADRFWMGDFAPMGTVQTLQPGYYGDLIRYPFHNPAKGGLNWSGDGRGCNELAGWFVVDSVTYANETIQSIDLRFEQRCDGAAAALHGKIRWTNS
jgi:PKD repeat protein